MLELVGAPEHAGRPQALATGGRIVVIGVGGGFKAELNLAGADGQARDAFAPRRCAPGRWRRRPPPRARWSARSCRCFDVGASAVPVAETFPLDAVGDAYERFAAGGKLGKIVLEPSS